jgi:hypothetical protein
MNQMNLKQWTIFSLASLMFVGCAGEVANQTIAGSPSPAVAMPSAQPTQVQPIAQAQNPAKSTTVKIGTFASGEHPTQGTVRIINQDGKAFLDIDQAFQTSSLGPDLVVILHRSSDVLGSTQPPAYPIKGGEYVLLAPLKKFTGAQRYAIPETVNLSQYSSAAIWCRKFNATFGAAKLVNPS